VSAALRAHCGKRPRAQRRKRRQAALDQLVTRRGVSRPGTARAAPTSRSNGRSRLSAVCIVVLRLRRRRPSRRRAFSAHLVQRHARSIRTAVRYPPTGPVRDGRGGLRK
jgi:hypothetical protein